MNLIQLASKYERLNYELMQSGGEITSDVEIYIDSLAAEVPQAVDTAAYLLKKLEADEEFFKAQADAFRHAAKVRHNARERLKDKIKLFSKATAQTKFQGDSYRITVGKAQPKVIIDEELLPRKYFMEVVVSKPDIELVRRDLMSEVVIPGASLTESTSLRIT